MIPSSGIGKTPLNETIRNEIVSLLHHSLDHVCGGGLNTKNSTCSFDFTKNQSCRDKNDNHELSWTQHLKELALKSISRSNGSTCTHAGSGIRNRDAIDDIGKAHDLEIRIALSLFHKYCSHDVITELNIKGTKKKKKKKRKMYPNQKNESENEHNNLESIKRESTLEIISDLGLSRSIISPYELATLIVRDMEDQLWARRNCDVNKDNLERKIVQSDASSLTCTSTVDTKIHDLSTMMIKVDHQSGIICVVTPQRIQYLRNNDRYPCSHCTKWCKGEKGLWWHEQTVHGLDHSSATALAAASGNGIGDLALVVYNHQTLNQRSSDSDNYLRLNGSSEVMNNEQNQESQDEDSYFELIKNGNIDKFINFLQRHPNQKSSSNPITHYDPTHTLDKNDASALHWAAGCGHVSLVKYLIEHCQCPPDQIQKGKRSFHGRTPLHWSARNGHLDVVKYLCENCNIDIDAKTIDGTTGFCWAAWQSHLDIMKYLNSRGTDVTSINSFGCNAVLWSAQSIVEGGDEDNGLQVIQFLESIGCDVELVNSNGHGILYKCAQRGKKDICEWIFSRLEQVYMEGDDEKGAKDGEEMENPDISSFKTGSSPSSKFKLNPWIMIAPDSDNCCPSDLAGMEGHTDLAQFLVNQEKKLGIQAFKNVTRLQNIIPSWFKKGLLDAKYLVNRSGLDDIFESGAAIEKMAAHVESYRSS